MDNLNCISKMKRLRKKVWKTTCVYNLEQYLFRYCLYFQSVYTVYNQISVEVQTLKADHEVLNTSFDISRFQIQDESKTVCKKCLFSTNK